MRVSWLILCSFVVMVGAAASCGLGGSSGSCLPSALQVQPQELHAGEVVAVSSMAFTCDHAYPRGKTYRLQLGLVGRGAPLPLGAFPVNTDGSFSAFVTIPPATPPGEGHVIVRGSPYDAPCEDVGSCAGYDVRLTVLAPNEPN